MLNHIEGDLLEDYGKRRTKNGKWRADIKFVWDVFLLMRPEIIRPLEGYKNLNTFGMYKNYFKISFRQLVKNKSFAFINIAGLTLGFTCFLLLALYIHDELSFDMFHRDADRIVRVLQHEQQEDGSILNLAQVSPMLGKETATQYQEVEDLCRLTAFGRVTLGNDPLSRGHERIWSPDANIFQFFDFTLVEGDPTTVLKNPDCIVITEALAKKYFGDESALGKTIWTAFRREGKPVYMTVTGIMKEPKNSHLQFQVFFSEATWSTLFDDYREYVSTDWVSNEYVTYFKLKPGTNNQTLAGKITELVKAHYPPDQPFKSSFTLQPLSDIHLYQDKANDAEINVNGIKPFYLYMFGAVGTLLLIIACLNYMNLSTAAAFKRTREMGTRKSLGALRGQLVNQFLTDSFILTAISIVMAVLVAQLAIPTLNKFTGKEMSLMELPASWMVWMGGIVLFTGLLSALYPAFVAIRVSAVEALKKEIKIGNSGLPIRKVLLVAQFAISIMMIASTLVIYRQLKFMREKDLGFNHENLLVIDINSDRLRRNFETVKTEFSKPTEVVSIATSTRVPGEWKNFPVATVNASGNTQGRDMIFVGIDKDFLKTYNIKLLEGRTIEDPRADSLKIVLTKMAVMQLGLTNPIGQMIEIPAWRAGGTRRVLEKPFQAEVIGVVEDFHFESLHREMMPVIFGAPNTVIQRIDYYTLRVKTNNWNETLATLKSINAKMDAENPLEYTFLESRFEDFYQTDAKRGQIFLTLSIIVVLIASMGLFALVSYSVESRTKEIGVRKVLGASVQSIVGLVSKEFLLLVLIGGLIAVPVAWYFAHQWLKDFAYRTNLGVELFILAAIVALLIAFITIWVRVIRAATVNPVKSLRTE
jgi:putative ABC transport system permease protein